MILKTDELWLRMNKLLNIVITEARKSIVIIIIFFVSTLAFAWLTNMFADPKKGFISAVLFSLWITGLVSVVCFGGVLLSILNEIRSAWRGYNADERDQYQLPKEIIGLIIIFNVVCAVGGLVYCLDPVREMPYNLYVKQFLFDIWPIYLMCMGGFVLWLLSSFVNHKK